MSLVDVPLFLSYSFKNWSFYQNELLNNTK